MEIKTERMEPDLRLWSLSRIFCTSGLWPTPITAELRFRSHHSMPSTLNMTQDFTYEEFRTTKNWNAFALHMAPTSKTLGLVSASPDNKVDEANMGPTWVLSDPDGPHVGPMNLAIREDMLALCYTAVLTCVRVLLQWNSTSVYTSCTYSTYHLELALATFICHFISACLICHTS